MLPDIRSRAQELKLQAFARQTVREKRISLEQFNKEINDYNKQFTSEDRKNLSNMLDEEKKNNMDCKSLDFNSIIVKFQELNKQKKNKIEFFKQKYKELFDSYTDIEMSEHVQIVQDDYCTQIEEYFKDVASFEDITKISNELMQIFIEQEEYFKSRESPLRRKLRERKINERYQQENKVSKEDIEKADEMYNDLLEECKQSKSEECKQNKSKKQIKSKKKERNNRENKPRKDKKEEERLKKERSEKERMEKEQSDRIRSELIARKIYEKRRTACYIIGKFIINCINIKRNKIIAKAKRVINKFLLIRYYNNKKKLEKIQLELKKKNDKKYRNARFIIRKFLLHYYKIKKEQLKKLQFNIGDNVRLTYSTSPTQKHFAVVIGIIDKDLVQIKKGKAKIIMKTCDIYKVNTV